LLHIPYRLIRQLLAFFKRILNLAKFSSRNPYSAGVRRADAVNIKGMVAE
jgi:hypothetical protein